MKLSVINQRECGDCSVCCYIAEVNGYDFVKAPHSNCPYLSPSDKGQCSIYGQSQRPAVCSTFQCSWLRGYGADNDRPDQNGIMVSVNDMNGGRWIFVIEIQPNAFRTTGKNIILDIASKIDLPVIVVDYNSKPPNDKGDYVIVKKSLLNRSKQLIREHLGFLDESEEFGIYNLMVN